MTSVAQGVWNLSRIAAIHDTGDRTAIMFVLVRARAEEWWVHRYKTKQSTISGRSPEQRRRSKTSVLPYSGWPYPSYWSSFAGALLLTATHNSAFHADAIIARWHCQTRKIIDDVERTTTARSRATPLYSPHVEDVSAGSMHTILQG